MIHICKQLQLSLANRDHPILLRGGIAIGDLFCESDIIYGEGLSSAYLLENNLAKYPRIIFTGDTLFKGLENTKYMFSDMEGLIPPYKEDDDALYYPDYLYPEFWHKDELVQYFDRLKSMCDFYLNQGIDINLREKYLWLKRKIEDSIKINSCVAEHYRKKETEKSEQHFEKYNSRFSMYPHEFDVKLKISED